MGKGLVAQGVIRRVLTHKEHAVGMVDSIIKETDLGVSSLFDLSRVCFSQAMFLCATCQFFFLMDVLI